MVQLITTKRDMRQHLRRLYNPSTRAWLHLSGSGETNRTAYAWAGTGDQARTLRDRAKVQGEAFPYMLAPLAAQIENA